MIKNPLSNKMIITHENKLLLSTVTKIIAVDYSS